MNKGFLRKLGGFIIALFLLSGIAVFSSSTAQAQRRVVIIRRPVYSPYWGFRRYPYWYDPFYNPYNSYYSHYVFRNSESAVGQGYKDGFDTGRSDGKKAKSFNPQRSHYYQEAGFGNFG